MRILMLMYPDIPQTSDEWMPSADTPDAAMGRYNKELSEAPSYRSRSTTSMPSCGACANSA